MFLEKHVRFKKIQCGLVEIWALKNLRLFLVVQTCNSSWIPGLKVQDLKKILNPWVSRFAISRSPGLFWENLEIPGCQDFKISRFPGLFLENFEIPGCQSFKISRILQSGILKSELKSEHQAWTLGLKLKTSFKPINLTCIRILILLVSMYGTPRPKKRSFKGRLFLTVINIFESYMYIEINK